MDTKLPIEARRRYGRQIRLADIGEAGQAKLCAAETHLHGDGFASAIERRYATASGMRVVDLQMNADPTHVDSTHFNVHRDSLKTVLDAMGLRHEAPSEIAEGALSALIAIREALGGSTS